MEIGYNIRRDNQNYQIHTSINDQKCPQLTLTFKNTVKYVKKSLWQHTCTQRTPCETHLACLVLKVNVLKSAANIVFLLANIKPLPKIKNKLFKA